MCTGCTSARSSTRPCSAVGAASARTSPRSSPAVSPPRPQPEQRYAAFLRGINVGRHHRVSNEELCAHFHAMGFEDVACFRASGNVVFSSEPLSVKALTAKVQETLAARLGYAVAAFIRDTAEVQAIAEQEPFAAAAVAASEGKLQVSLLAKAPPAKARSQVLALAGDEDRLSFGDRELYWLPAGGLLDSPLDLEAIDRLLGVSTRRTKGTIEQLAAKHFRE